MRLIAVGALSAVLCASLAVSGVRAQTPAQTPQPQQPPAQTPVQEAGTIAIASGDSDFDPNQPIKPGFQLSVNVSSAAGPEADLTGPVAVDPTGSLQLKLVGMIDVRGLTPAQASDKIAAQLKPYVKDPKVSVTILSVPKPVVFLSGAVNRPGATPVNDSTTLVELVTIIGFTDNADLSRVRVVHRDEKGVRVAKEYNLLRWLKPNPGEPTDDATNPVLSDRDFVFVPLKNLPGTGSVSVSGDVVRPGVIPLRVGVPTTLREVLSMTGGVNPTADHQQVILRRLGVEKPMVVDYDRAEAGEAGQDVTVLPDDIVYVQKLGIDKFVNLNGAFVRPGKQPYLRTVTLTQMIAEGGGLQLGARAHEGRIFRHVGGADPTRTQVIAFNYYRIRANKEPDLMIEPGDTIEVPVGNPPRPTMDAFQLSQTLLSIALLVDRLCGGGRYNY